VNSLGIHDHGLVHRGKEKVTQQGSYNFLVQTFIGYKS